MNRGILGYLVRVAFFLVIGPIIGGFALLVGAAFGGTPEALGLILLVPLFVAGCYVAGWQPALVTGLILSAAGPRIGSRKALAIVTVLVGAASSFLLKPADREFETTSGTILFVLAGAAAAAACAWLLDRIKLMRPQATPAA
jgi:hypothetical protein